MSDDYDVSLYVEYNNTREYRNVIRKIFKMDMKKMEEEVNNEYETEGMDEETKDELLYDNEKSIYMMDKVFDLTKNNALFLKLYELAAAKMLSCDHLIGECILFSYDYLYFFHLCLCRFIKNPEDFNEDCIEYIQLKEKLKKK
jgi:hypothetical protein